MNLIDTFQNLIIKKSLPNILKKAVNKRGSAKIHIGDIERRESLLKQPTESIKLENIIKHQILGEGSFGQVWMTIDKRDKKAYAMKIQSKKRILKENQHFGVMRERSIMEIIDHPFVINLVSTFQDEMNLYMITNLYLGGDLRRLLLKKKSRKLSERKGKFYTACVLEAISAMHKKSICYRDMKSENILLDADGYCILVDLGFAIRLAKVVTKKTSTLCGTPLYMAPEVILQCSYDHRADMWSLGVLLYELIIGGTPFYSPGITQKDLFKRICLTKYKIKNKCSTSAEHLITKLLKYNPQDRLGSLPNTSNDMHDHIWFRGIDFDLLVEKKIKALWIPELENSLDCEYFKENPKFRNEQENSLLTPKEQLFFFGY